jgi:protein-L-isoaspartate(D-aspartate) O-methyltransferase
MGYSAAVIARMAEAVVAVEESEALSQDAEETLSDVGADNVIYHHGSIAEGAPQHGPYDVIVVQGGVEALPDAIVDQLKNGGRIGCIFMEGALGSVRIGYKSQGEISWRFDFNAGAPVLSGFQRESSFAL